MAKCDDQIPRDCSDAFSDIKQSLAKMQEKQDTALQSRERAWRQIDKLAKVMLGNGQPGIIGRIDRLEQQRNGWLAWGRRVWAIIVALVLAYITYEIKRGPNP